jgi:hypothetical protein
MPYLIIDKEGRTTSDLVLPKLSNKFAESKEGDQLYLEGEEE